MRCVGNSVFGCFNFKYFLRKKELSKRSNVLFLFSLGNCGFYFVYKFLLLNSSNYSTTILNELPLQPCNVVMLVLPFALTSSKNVLKSFCFYFGLFSSIIALITPIEGFESVQFFSVEFLYYWYHVFLLASCICLVLFGLYRPKIKDLPKLSLIIAVNIVLVHLVNVFLRNTYYAEANYFFTFLESGNVISDLFYSLVPVPLLYLLLPFVIVFSIFIAVTTISKFVFSLFKN